MNIQKKIQINSNIIRRNTTWDSRVKLMLKLIKELSKKIMSIKFTN